MKLIYQRLMQPANDRSCEDFSDACMTNPSARSGGRRWRRAKVSEVDDTSIRNKQSTEGYPVLSAGYPLAERLPALAAYRGSDFGQ